MSIRNATILTGATIAATGGTSSTLKATGAVIAGGIQVVDASITDIRLRPTITFKARPASLQRDGSYSKQKVDYTIRMPKLLADGTVGLNLSSGTLSVHPESTTAEIVKLCTWSSQIYFDTDFTDFVQSAVPE